MGSEMCIRDSDNAVLESAGADPRYLLPCLATGVLSLHRAVLIEASFVEMMEI